MLKAAGCNWVIVAHSERRQYFGETNEDARKKIVAALEAGLTPIYCVGEQLDERAGGTNARGSRNSIAGWHGAADSGAVLEDRDRLRAGAGPSGPAK